MAPAAGVGGGEEPGGPRGRVARFRPFQDIYGYSGVSVVGQTPPRAPPPILSPPVEHPSPPGTLPGPSQTLPDPPKCPGTRPGPLRPPHTPLGPCHNLLGTPPHNYLGPSKPSWALPKLFCAPQMPWHPTITLWHPHKPSWTLPKTSLGPPQILLTSPKPPGIPPSPLEILQITWNPLRPPPKPT